LTTVPETKGAVVSYIKHERNNMATTIDAKRNKVYKPGRYKQEPEAGDIVELAAISSRDPLHRNRHQMLWMEYEVISVAGATPEKKGHDYNGWYSLILTPTIGTAKVPYGKEILIMTCQVKILSRSKEVVVKTMYTKESRRAHILTEINEIVSSPKLLAGEKIIIWNDDKQAWNKLARGMYPVQWRNLANDRPKWVLASTNFPFVTTQDSIEFRVTPGKHRLEFSKKYYLKGAI